MNNITIVSCDFGNVRHCEALIGLMNEYITDKMGGGEPYNEEQKIKLTEGLKKHPSKLICLAKADGRFVGLVTCFINFATFTVRPFINIHDLIVTMEYRGRGVGRKLLEHVCKVAEEMDCSKVTLEVREDNANARALYNSLDFSDAGPRQFYLTKYI